MFNFLLNISLIMFFNHKIILTLPKVLIYSAFAVKEETDDCFLDI